MKLKHQFSEIKLNKIDNISISLSNIHRILERFGYSMIIQFEFNVELDLFPQI